MNTTAELSRTTLAQIIRLATRDLIHQRLSSAVLVLALAAVLTPLLVLFGLKFGVIDNLLRELMQDPRNREIRLIGHGRFDAGWFAQMRALDEIAFVVPRTRGAATTIDLRPENASQPQIKVELIPSGQGDPLLQGHAAPPDQPGSVVLSAASARAIGATPGTRVKASVRRKIEGQWSRVHALLTVAAVVPDSVFPRKGAFVMPALLVAIEDYRDGYAVPEYNWGEGEAFNGPRYYSGFRLYVRELDDVAHVRDLLRAQEASFEVSTKARAIEEVRLFDRYLTATFLMIAFIGVAGFLLSFGASMWVNVERKQRELSVLQLLGFRSPIIMLFPIVQSGLIALSGAVLAIIMFFGISVLINGYFAREAGQFDGLCRLLPSHLAISLVATLVCAVVAAGLAAYRSTRIEPSKGLREL
ncbi:MAG: peptide ABC transporter permease [Gammaproteobacteria bacterium]|nr:peptide ABC transporter permease [Gammaproteobacteria bacterium]